MVTLSPRYQMREDAPDGWSIVDHMPDGVRYINPGIVIELHPTKEQALERLHSLWDDDMPRVKEQLEHIYRRNGMLPRE